MFLLNFSSLGQMNDKVWNYIQQYHTIAVSEMQRTGIPASITLAQGLLESGIGESKLAKQGNNHFGIKCHNWQGPSMRHNDDKPNECFRVYGSAYESYIDHSDFLKNRERYSRLFQYASNDYVNWAKGLKACGYATNPKYADLLIERIEKYYLHIFDKPNWQTLLSMVSKNRQLSQGETIVETSATYQKQNEPVTTETAIIKELPLTMQPAQAITPKQENETTGFSEDKIDTKIAKQQPEMVPQTAINEINFTPSFNIKTVNGKTAINYNMPINLLQVSRDYGISIKKLMEYNEVKANYTFSASDNIFVQKKRNRFKGNECKHKVKPGQTLGNIAQQYGLSTKHLKKINDIDSNRSPKAGTFIKLKKNCWRER